MSSRSSQKARARDGLPVEVRGERREDTAQVQALGVRHIVRGHNVSEKAVAQAIELSETKYCSVAATLSPAAEIVSSFEIQEDEGDAAS